MNFLPFTKVLDCFMVLGPDKKRPGIIYKGPKFQVKVFNPTQKYDIPIK